MQADYKSLLAPCQATPAVAKAMGYSEQIKNPPEIVPAITRGWASVDVGRPTVLESITQDEGELSKFQFV